MADTPSTEQLPVLPIEDLPYAMEVTSESKFPISQNGIAMKVLGDQIADFARNAAGRSAADAQAAKEAAEAAQKAAETARDAAEGSSTLAAESATEAAESAEKAVQYSGKPPIIQEGRWWTWDAEAQTYTDTGKRAVLNFDMVYPSYEAMEADKGNQPAQTTAIISSDVSDPHNAEIYIHNGTDWQFLADLSGFTGVGIESIAQTGGDHAPGTTDTYTITTTDGKEYTIAVYNGKDGKGAGDMEASVYDPQGRAEDIFAAIDSAKTAAEKAQEAAEAAQATADSKQDKLTGQPGQVVGFDEKGNAVAQAAPDTGVTSFNGRDGAVVPKAGDYSAEDISIPSETAEMLGLDPADDPTVDDAFKAIAGGVPMTTLHIFSPFGSTITVIGESFSKIITSTGEDDIAIYKAGTYSVTRNKDGKVETRKVEVTAEDIGNTVDVVLSWRYGFRKKKAESDPYVRIEYLYDAVGMTPAHMDFDKGEFDYGDFGGVWFVTKNRPVMLKYDRTVDYELDHNDQTKKLDGTPSDISNTSYQGNAMSEIPLGWVYRYEDAQYEYEIVCEHQWDEKYKAYAHTRADGSIADYFYWGMFGGSGSATKIRSIAGQTAAANLTAQNGIDGCKANGNGWYTHTWSQREYIRTLLVLMGKVALVLCMILGWLVDFAQGYLDLGVAVPVAAAICVYICLMEITSIIENVCKINPDILPDKLASLFGGLKKDGKEEGGEG